MPTFSLTLREERSLICRVSFLCLIYDRRKKKKHFDVYHMHFTLKMTICCDKFSRSKAKDASSDSVLTNN